MTRPRPDHTVTGSAPSRLCLAGEDLDWIGGPALLTAIELRVVVTVVDRVAPVLTICSHGALTARLDCDRQQRFAPTTSELELARLCWQHARGARSSDSGAEITIESIAPPNAGLASSATACVAILRALSPDSPQSPQTSRQLAEAAYHVERTLAERGVGPMDFVPAAFGGTHLVHSAAEQITSITPLWLPPQARFLVVDTRTPRDTGAVIAWKRRRLAEGERGIRHYAERMPGLVDEQAGILAAGGDLWELGHTINEAQTLLCHQLGVSTPLIDACVARLRAAGALGVKLTGTGLGGCLFALTTTDHDATGLAASLQDLPVGVQLVGPATTGAALHSIDVNPVAGSRRRQPAAPTPR